MKKGSEANTDFITDFLLIKQTEGEGIEEPLAKVTETLSES